MNARTHVVATHADIRAKAGFTTPALEKELSPIHAISTDLLDALPNPILVKDAQTRYVWVNRAFEHLFQVSRTDLVGRLDSDVFPQRQVAQCNGGDLRVLASGELDEATEIVTDPVRGERHTITRKIRQTDANGVHFLLGVMHDVTDVVTANQKFCEAAAELEKQAIMLRQMATTDPLTGCLNRRALYTLADELFDQGTADCALMVLDIDHFKAINDRHGHAAGDTALQHFTTCVKQTLREGDVLARIGGEEFSVLLPGVDPITAESIASRIVAHVAASPLRFDGACVQMTVSIGVKHHKAEQPPSLDDMLRLADDMLYRAKTEGRNRYMMAG